MYMLLLPVTGRHPVYADAYVPGHRQAAPTQRSLSAVGKTAAGRIAAVWLPVAQSRDEDLSTARRAQVACAWRRLETGGATNTW